MNIMVTGAAGGYGSYAVNFLKEFAPNDNIIALVRDNTKKAELEAKGFEVRVADYADLSGLTKAMQGVDRLLFVSVPVFDLQKNVVAAAKASGVKYIAYTSICEPQYSKFGLEINHKQTEELIRQTGIPHTFLRNGWYVEMMMPYIEASAKMGVFPYYAGDAKVAWVAKRDLAEAGARVIANGCDEEILELSGNAVTYAELAKSTGKAMEIKPVSRNEFLAVMAKSGISQMGMMLAQSYQDYAVQGNNGEEKLTSDVLEKVIGHKLTKVEDLMSSM